MKRTEKGFPSSRDPLLILVLNFEHSTDQQGFRLTLGEKDVRYYLEHDEQFGLPVEMYEHIHFLMQQAQNQGFETQSWAVFTQFLEGKKG
jgi:3-hydroxyisobutyrate dehydrogenase-like beta-hydroxyacid dehydrogenase